MPELRILPCLDSDAMASSLQRDLNIRRERAIALAHYAVAAADNGYYISATGHRVDWRDAVQSARANKQSIPPGATLPRHNSVCFAHTSVQIANETTLSAAQRLIARGLRPLALNFASGTSPGGGFLKGSRAQEEALCRSSALYHTLKGDAMYEAHLKMPTRESTDWAIYSPEVPIFRADDGQELPQPWLLSFITCSAPKAKHVGQPHSGDLLQKRIHRVLAIAQSYGYDALVLGAWGCGAYANDPQRTAIDFHNALINAYSGIFSDVIFAIADWTPTRKILGPFRQAFPAP
jgi:uncharacterized protein (TIGR02452 family)